MSAFAINLVLAVAWQALNGDFSLMSLAVGFVIGYIVLCLLQPLLGRGRYGRQVFDVFALIVYFHYELIVSSLRVAWHVLTPGQRSTPGIIAVPLKVCTDAEITVLGNLISLTPGSLTIDVSEDKRTLLVHSMFIDDPDDERRSIKNGMEKRVLEALR